MNAIEDNAVSRANDLKANSCDSKWTKPELKLLNGDQVDGKAFNPTEIPISSVGPS